VGRLAILGLLLAVAISSCSQMNTPDRYPTPDEIMADGEVNPGERELARRAVYECLVAAGIDTAYELFDVDFTIRRDYPVELDACSLSYMGLYRANEINHADFDYLALGLVECVEDRTESDFGELPLDEIGRLTEQAKLAVSRARQIEADAYDQCLRDRRELVEDNPDLDISTAILEYRFDNGDERRVSFKVADCGYAPTVWLTEETEEKVTVWGRSLKDRKGACWIRHPVRLKYPLDQRPLIDETTRKEIPQSTDEP